MDNEPTSAIINGDNTDTHSQVNGTADNASRHSSRIGSARSGRSKAASVREAVVLDNLDDRKPPVTAAASPRPDVTTNGDRQHSAAIRSKIPSPTVPVVDTPGDEFNDDMIDQNGDHGKSELEDIVSLFLNKFKIFCFF